MGTSAYQLSPFKAKMAMAVRTKNTHWIMREITRRHWLTLGAEYGVVTPDGRGVAALLDELVTRTPEVVRTVRAMLPQQFPTKVADHILNGLQAMAAKLAS